MERSAPSGPGGRLLRGGRHEAVAVAGHGDGSSAAWTTVAFEFPPALLSAGRNEVAVTNLAKAATFGSPPHVLLADVRLEPAGTWGPPMT
jgi:hypothetical protein